ncbi:tRNA (Guanine37-N(1)-) methyltransferase [Arboricoccus pini]|uniref:tRNA (guanine-N(1)-)-methyltransferase n=1 Tax=Arboricoccus pini TaxID=1963835 RepID=A0A212QP05_9PROT|nr:tRNA (guanosine(37)-N1)-methyltransferase TrmD [Arboricoccus pini]SNB60986.1 tRNA (Guanine37-N(1)-) methyltransferase [Arboricoccus pini]
MTEQPWTVTVLSLFPQMFPGPLDFSLSGRAKANGRWRLVSRNLRDAALDKHHTVDDTPFGGGAGMVMRPDVVARAVDEALGQGAKRPLIYMSPRGRRFDQAMARELVAGPGMTILCGRFEGVDERVLEARNFLEISIGDFVLSGGETAALCMIDACVRLIPDVMGAAESLVEESFSDGLLEYPHYTRPQEWEGRRVPDILLSGHHGRVKEWRRQKSLEITAAKRPDLLTTAAGRDPWRSALAASVESPACSPERADGHPPEE